MSAVDVLAGIGWLPGSNVRDWRVGRLPFLEAGMQVNAARIATVMELLRQWAAARGLRPAETEYLARTPGREPLRFTETGDPALEQAYRTHWFSPELSEQKQQRLVAKASQAPDLVVISPHDRDWKCHRCGGSGDLLMMEPPGPACLRCVGLGELEFLPAGDAKLSRRAKAKSSKFAVVVRFSRTRKRYERQGLLVEPAALAAARAELSGS